MLDYNSAVAAPWLQMSESGQQRKVLAIRDNVRCAPESCRPPWRPQYSETCHNLPFAFPEVPAFVADREFGGSPPVYDHLILIKYMIRMLTIILTQR